MSNVNPITFREMQFDTIRYPRILAQATPSAQLSKLAYSPDQTILQPQSLSPTSDL